jgi:hypothetical protein
VGLKFPEPGRFTIVIWGEARTLFPEAPENTYADQWICAQGKIREYDGIMEMIVESPDAIEIRP